MKFPRGLLLCLASAVAVTGCGGSGSSDSSTDPASTPDAVAKLTPSAEAQIKALMEEKAAWTPTQRKISSQLLYAKSGRFPALKQTRQKGEAGAPGGLQSLMQFDDQGRVLSDIKGDVDANLQRAIETEGGKVVASSLTHRSVRAWLPLASLETLAGQSIVKAIRPALMATTNRADGPRAKVKAESYADRVAKVQTYLHNTKKAGGTPAARFAGAGTNAGSVTSEGSLAHGVDRARKFYNTDGTGVKIGVLSDSDDFLEESIASGDLPPDTLTIPGQSGRPGSGEGTAMMEIVHDVAPGAKLFFASAFESPEVFADNIRRLRFEYGCDIIIDDIIYYFESPYQDDIIAQAVQDVKADGALYFSSAGNQGNFDDGTSGTWEGDFKSGGRLATLPTGYQVHDFGAGVISNRVELLGGPLILHWSDPGSLDNPLSGNDYDIFVLDENLRNVLVAATDVQDGDDLPFEFLGFLIPSELRVVIARVPGAQTRAIRTVLFGGELGLATDGGTYGHSATDGAMSVAAVDIFQAVDGEFVGGPTTPVELFSTDGNRRVFYDRNGVRIRGGVTFASGGGEFRLKPEITAADGVVTTLPGDSGLNPFFGTSAAAPHAGAIAGLVKAAVPSLGTFGVEQALINGALDIEQAHRDHNSGAGIVSAMNSLRIAGAKPAVFLDLGTSTATAGGGGAINPGGSGSLTVQLINNGGQNATGVSATLSTTTPGVTITSANSAYPNIAAGASATNTTAYTFNVGASVPCGTRIDFTLTASFTGRGTSPKAFSLSVQTGSANPTATTFSYTGPVVPIPDSSGAGVDIPLNLGAFGRLARLSFAIDGATCSSAIGATTVGVDHTWVGDLIFTLRSPGGTSVRVINQAGGSSNSGNNFCQTVLEDGAANSIQNVTSTQAPFTGTFSPANAQSAFTGEVADGVWNLNVSDNAGFDTGSVRAFSVRASGFSCAAPP